MSMKPPPLYNDTYLTPEEVGVVIVGGKVILNDTADKPKHLTLLHD